jgi:hypothetical protein
LKSAYVLGLLFSVSSALADCPQLGGHYLRYEEGTDVAQHVYINQISCKNMKLAFWVKHNETGEVWKLGNKNIPVDGRYRKTDKFREFIRYTAYTFLNLKLKENSVFVKKDNEAVYFQNVFFYLNNMKNLITHYEKLSEAGDLVKDFKETWIRQTQ